MSETSWVWDALEETGAFRYARGKSDVMWLGKH